MRSSGWDKETIKGKFSSFLLLMMTTITMIALFIGGMLGTVGPYAFVITIGAMIVVIIMLLRQDELAVTVVIAVHLYFDWYLGLHLVALLLAFVLLLVFFLARSSQHPWVEPRALWLWGVFLLITIYPAIRGGVLMLYDAASYYPSNILGACMMFWLGIVVARNKACVRRFFKIFAAFGTLLAIHTLIQAITGVVLFSSPHIDAFLAQSDVLNYQLAGSDAHRAGSFFIDPNWNGTFFATIFFLPFGLFVESSSLLEKALYLAEMCLILPALLFTYSNGAWIGIFAGIIAFEVFVGRNRYRVLLPIFILIGVVIIEVLFQAQIALQFQHATGANEVSLRVAAWQTAIQVIEAFPLTGVGLGYQAYLLRADPYRVPAQFVPLSHPHDSYLEWGAMGGLPVFIIFMALMLFALCLAMRNWRLVDVRTRSLLGGGIAAVIALSINSVSINGWTLPPLAAIGWLILGVISSPLLAKSLSSEVTQEKK